MTKKVQNQKTTTEW